MSWLWVGGEGPHQIPEWADSYLSSVLKVSLEFLLCVERASFERGVPVTLIRVFNPGSVPEGTEIEDFTSLDQHPELILYEGFREEKSGKVTMLRVKKAS